MFAGCFFYTYICINKQTKNIMTNEQIKTNVENILKLNLPKTAYRSVIERKNVLGGGTYLQIIFAACEQGTGCATGNRPQQVSLCLDLADLELSIQIYGGAGGQSLTIEPEDKRFYCSRVRVPFRTPKKELKNVLSALKRFCDKWTELIDLHKDNLMYQDITNYNELLNK